MPEGHISILSFLDWASADEEHDPSTYTHTTSRNTLKVLLVRAPFETDTGEFRSIGQKERYEKRKNAMDALDQLREELFTGQWDG